jgi:hypothetical protein
MQGIGLLGGLPGSGKFFLLRDCSVPRGAIHFISARPL